MQLLKNIFFFLAFLPVAFQIAGQPVTTYDLLTEKYVDRPIAMHKGQFQFNSGYELSIISRKYDQFAEKIDLAYDGSVSAKHLVPFEMKFGLLDYIQLSASTNYGSLGIRSQEHKIQSGDNTIDISELNQYKGMYDLYLGTDLTAPIKWHPLNWLITAGLSFPVFGYEPDKPAHSYVVIDSLNAKLYYKYNKNFSAGVPIVFLGSSLKIRTRLISFKGMVVYSTGIKDGESYDWKFRMVDNKFEYEKVEYQFNYGRTIDYCGEVAVQAIKWFTVWGAFSGYKHTGAWNNLTRKKIGAPEEYLANVSVGYELLVSPNLRINQKVIIPVAGKNLTAPVTFFTGLSVNFISAAYH